MTNYKTAALAMILAAGLTGAAFGQGMAGPSSSGMAGPSGSGMGASGMAGPKPAMAAPTGGMASGMAMAKPMAKKKKTAMKPDAMSGGMMGGPAH